MAVEDSASFPRSSLYPSRTRRETLIAALRPGEKTWIAGRLLQVDDALWRLEDRSGTVELDLSGLKESTTSAGAAPFNAGDLAELKGTLLENRCFQATDLRVLAPGRPEAPSGSANAPLWRLPKDFFTVRRKMKDALRRFFLGHGFEEVETPILVSAPGQEPYLDPFVTTLDRTGERARQYLITSPEYAHKRLLAAGFEKIFEIARVFRNGPSETRGLHHVEFTMVEWYRAYASYIEIMEDTECLIRALAEEAAYPGKDDLKPPYERITMTEAFNRYAQVDLEPYLEDASSFAEAEAMQGAFGLKKTDDAEARFFKIFISAVEPKLGIPRPVFLIDFPASQASLSKIRHDAPQVCERFELYYSGVELANGFTELNDPDEQAERFRHEGELREKRGAAPVPVDESFLEALRLGMPPSGGVALGFDRMLMLLVGAEDLKTVMPFIDG